MVPPAMLCRQHLLGEHRELHALVGIISKGTSLTGYIDNGLVETDQIENRHTDLVAEMRQRGYNHHSPLQFSHPGPGMGRVNDVANVKELHKRCAGCRERINNAATDW